VVIQGNIRSSKIYKGPDLVKKVTPVIAHESRTYSNLFIFHKKNFHMQVNILNATYSERLCQAVSTLLRFLDDPG
jgi:hypothetical protein